jgi:TPR repeat protein
MPEKSNFALVPRPPSEIEKAEPGAKRVLSGMVADALALISGERSSTAAIEDTLLENWYRMGQKYKYADGVSESNTEAIKWFRKAAEQGHVKAQFELGCCYIGGRFPNTDDWGEAVFWFRKAAEAGHSTAQGILGQLYETGEYVGKDFAEAAKLYRQAAKGMSLEEDCEDEFGTVINLARCYRQGHGVAKDLAEAYMWLKFGAEVLYSYFYNDEAKAELASLCREMSQSELADGENRYKRLQQQRREQFGEL